MFQTLLRNSQLKDQIENGLAEPFGTSRTDEVRVQGVRRAKVGLGFSQNPEQCWKATAGRRDYPVAVCKVPIHRLLNSEGEKDCWKLHTVDHFGIHTVEARLCKVAFDLS